ncbi:helix-turn-helix transcriptional regulator [Microbacterium sp. p3-SID336]|uniref:ArsR/SmtB family transcription factor n=1 Tax=Microbacterium sp. p3-SID336 TaxID=2916212 RepID=UPI0021A27E1A|nr:metalloregulator ArsR/SmtB family transcription factor [Microbacterium sp. p3-SID336]MCT1478473.1 metalloregulator ArsR/SmtB family transcription factor [Microbacterium sp. p3-SID336]
MNDSHVRVAAPGATFQLSATLGSAELTNNEAEQLAEIMQALASPLRLRILSSLRTRQRTVTELSELLNAGQTTVSNHLRLLRHLGLVNGDRHGRHVHYTLFDEHINELLDEAVGHLKHLPQIQ